MNKTNPCARRKTDKKTYEKNGAVYVRPGTNKTLYQAICELCPIKDKCDEPDKEHKLKCQKAR